MITIESMMAIDKNDLLEASKTLNKDDIPQLVEWLSLKDDNIRYHAFLMLQSRSSLADDVYPFWQILRSKLRSDNSYQRSIGLMLIAENAKWDTEGRMEEAIDEYLALLNDEKPITIRQCVQSLGKIASRKPDLDGKIAEKLIAFDLASVKETMRKSILLDIIDVLLIIRNAFKTEEIDSFIHNALIGGVLDKKTAKRIEGLLK